MRSFSPHGRAASRRIACRARRPIVTLAVAGLLSATGCKLSTEPIALPCFSCPSYDRLWLEGDTTVTVGDTLRLRAFASGATIFFAVGITPVPDGTWTLSAPSRARLLVTPATTRDTAAVGTAALIPGRAGLLVVNVRWQDLEALHQLEVQPRGQ